jgi:hypothetical protein
VNITSRISPEEPNGPTGFPFSEVFNAPAFPTRTIILRAASNCLGCWPSIVPLYVWAPSDLIETHTGWLDVKATRTAPAASFASLGAGWREDGGMVMVPLSETTAGRNSAFEAVAAGFGRTLGCTLADVCGAGFGDEAADCGLGMMLAFCHSL